jgi:hypothetical protein
MKYILEYRVFEYTRFQDIELEIEKAITKDWITKQESHYETEILDMYNIETGKEETEITDEVRDFLTEELMDRAESAVLKIKSLVKDGQLRIWREITVNEDYLDHLSSSAKRLGIYWSWDEASAHAHWGYGDGRSKIVKFEATVPLGYIDWVQTIQANSDLFLFEENEITLIKGVPVTLSGLKVDGNPVDLTNINKQFKA